MTTTLLAVNGTLMRGLELNPNRAVFLSVKTELTPITGCGVLMIAIRE
ncbi:hypothetical protein [Escherichia coli]|nr:hypothetical protein [Escherichia coli]